MEFIGNCATQIDWDLELSRLDNGITLLYNEESFDKSLPQFAEMDRVWQDAGYQYNDTSIEWTNYFPDSDLVSTFSEIVQATPWMVWFSKIRPGKMAPWHVDAHSKINELLALGEPVRYTCYVQEPHHAHISVVEDHCVHLPNKGDIYKWPSYESWHCGVNAGLSNKFMFNYWGYIEHQ
jgi:hypothetical protein